MSFGAFRARSNTSDSEKFDIFDILRHTFSHIQNTVTKRKTSCIYLSLLMAAILLKRYEKCFPLRIGGLEPPGPLWHIDAMICRR